jgi:hypothetical protein
VTTFVSALKAWDKVKIVYTTSKKDPAMVIAARVQANLERMRGEGPTKGVLAAPPLVLVIMDRTMDPVTPLLHDLYYYPL